MYTGTRMRTHTKKKKEQENMEPYWFESNLYLEFPQGWAWILFWGLIVLDSDSVFSHHWWFFSPLACPCQLRPYYEIPLGFLSCLPVFIICHVKTDSLVSAAPGWWLKLNIGKPWLDLGAWQGGQGWSGPGEEAVTRTLSTYSQQGGWNGGPKHTLLFLCVKQGIQCICGSKISWGWWLERLGVGTIKK